MTRVPTLTPLLGLSQARAGVTGMGARDVRKRVNPGMRWREAQEHGDHAAFAPQNIWGVLIPGL